MNTLDFSTFVKILYPYCSVGGAKYEFVVIITDNIMEESGDLNNPLAGYMPDHRTHIFNGTKPISRKTATIILGHLDKFRFEEYLDNTLTDDARQSISDSLNNYKLNTNLNDVTLHCANLLERILRYIVSGDWGRYI